MKRVIAVLLMLCICASFTACNHIEVKPTQNTSETTPTYVNIPTSPSTNEGTVMQMPMYAISLPTTEKFEYAADGAVIFQYSYQSVALIGPDPEVADTVILDLLNRIDASASEADTVKQYAHEAYLGAQIQSPYFYKIQFEPVRLDQSVLSLYCNSISNCGTSHPITTSSSVNYDLTNGKILCLSDILITDTSGTILSDFVIEILAQNKDAYNLYDEYTNTVIDRFNKPLDNDECWHLDENGLTFYFSPYAIAPYASGSISATISYSDLTGILKDEYFPAEQETASGEVFAIDFTDEACENFSQFSEIIFSENGKKFIMYTDNYVRNVTLYTGTWDNTNGAFTADSVVYYAKNLTPGDAIMVQCELNAEIPTLYLRYTSNGEVKNCYIMLNKQTHNVHLIK